MSFTKTTFSQRAVKYSLCLSIGLLSACKGPEDVKAVSPAAEVVNEAQIAPDPTPKEPAAPTKPTIPSPENNYGYETTFEMENMVRLSRLAIREYQKIGIVKDIGIKYPEWPFGDPVEPNGSFISGVRRYEVRLVKALRGDLPEIFKYDVYSEAGEVLLNKNPYPLAFCFSERTQTYVAREIEGQMFDDPKFLQVFLDQWEKAEPVDLSDKPCWFDVDD